MSRKRSVRKSSDSNSCLGKSSAVLVLNVQSPRDAIKLTGSKKAVPISMPRGSGRGKRHMKRKLDAALPLRGSSKGSGASRRAIKAITDNCIGLLPDRIREIADFFDESPWHTLSPLALCDIADEVRDNANARTYGSGMTPRRMREIADFLDGAQWHTLSARDLCDIADELRDCADTMRTKPARRRHTRSIRGRNQAQRAPVQTFV